MLKKFSKYHHNEDGFTLIELLIVVLIIGILAAIAIPVYLGIQNQAYRSAVKGDVNLTVKRVQVALTQGTPLATIKANPTAYKQVSRTDLGETVTIGAAASAPTDDTQFGVTGSMSTTGTPKSPIDYSYAYDSITGQFTDGSSGGVALGGGNGGTYDPTTVGSLTVPNAKSTYTAVNTLETDLQTTTPNWLVYEGHSSLVDSNGSFYNNCAGYAICKSNGTTSALYAGATTYAPIADGPASVARFGLPASMVTDSSGNIYVFDIIRTAGNTSANQYKIRKINPLTGQVSTLQTVNTTIDLTSNRAGLSLTADGKINVFYTYGNISARLQQLDPTNNTVTTLYNGTSNGAALSIWTDTDGTIYYSMGNTLYKRTTGGTTTTLISGVPGAIATMLGDGNYLYYTTGSTGPYGITRIAKTGGSTTMLNTYTGGCTPATGPQAINSCVQNITDMVIAPDGTFYFTDKFDNTTGAYWLRSLS